MHWGLSRMASNNSTYTLWEMAEVRPKKRRSDEYLARRREIEKERTKTRIYIGESFQRWRELRRQKGFLTDAQLAKFLLDSHEKETDGTSRPPPSPPVSRVGSESFLGRGDSPDDPERSTSPAPHEVEVRIDSEDEDEDSEDLSSSEAGPEEVDSDDPDYTADRNGNVDNRMPRKWRLQTSREEQDGYVSAFHLSVLPSCDTEHPLLNKSGGSRLHGPHPRVTAPSTGELLRMQVSRGIDDEQLHKSDEQLQEKSCKEPKPSQEPHRTKKVFECPTCRRVFPRNCALQRHLVIHSGKRPFKCFICGRGFTQGGNLKTHMKTHKEDSSKWTLLQEKSAPKESLVTVHVCGECGMDFPQKEQLEEHRETHKKPYACPECGKTFKNKDYFKIHISSHSGDSTFLCSECGKHFLTAIALKKHKLTHTGEKNFHCDQCGKAFSQVSHLKVHLRTHSGERPHLCAICGKSYSRAGHLRIHLRVHTGERPYNCEACGKSFQYAQNYSLHLKRHNKKPTPCTKPLGRPKQNLMNNQ
ncbi:uncharacterized protein ACBR49_000384 isoform 2-T2 [Aulostomus maculatus]